MRRRRPIGRDLRSDDPLVYERLSDPILVKRAKDGDPARAAEDSELRAELGARLAEISPAQAKVVVLKHGFDFSFEEIAGAEGMPVGTAKSHAHRGRNGLRERLSA